MNLVQRLLTRFSRRRDLSRPARRSIFNAADTGRLHSSWTTTNHSADAELYNNLSTLRARSRELVRNNGYAKGFVGMVSANVIGHKGIRLQSQVMQGDSADDLARLKIEEGWRRWSGQRQEGAFWCDVTGRHSMRDIQRLVVHHLVTDGEVLVRKVRGASAGNPFRFSLQLIEADHLDHNYNDTLTSGNKVKMGVEVDGWGKPAAYWLFPKHPGDARFGYAYGERVRISADEIIHLYIPSRISANRGLPWMSASMTDFNMLGGYIESELVAARVAAAKMGFFKRQEGHAAYQGDDTEDNAPVVDADPGTFEALQDGWDFVPWDPTHPNTAFADFLKGILRGVAAGLGVPYFKLAGDLEAVSYSSARVGELDARTVWRELQQYLVENFLEPVFMEWLRWALLTREVNLPMAKFDKFAVAEWRPRGWQWVDPQKDANAKLIEIQNGWSNYSEVAAEQGKDLEEVARQYAADVKTLEKYGVIIAKPQGQGNEQNAQN